MKLPFRHKWNIESLPGKIAFVLLGILVLFIATITIIEKYAGTPKAWTYGYGSIFFMFLWFGIVGLSVAHIFLKRKSTTKPAIFLHLSLVVILLGALITRLTGQNGVVHLRLNQTALSFKLENGKSIPLPYPIRLDSFRVKYYPGTQTPVDYQSAISVAKPEKGQAAIISVSMNHIGRLGSCRLYQTSFDDDQQGTILTVNNDPWGIAITYSGYLLLGIFMLWSLIAPQGGFRGLLKHPLLKGAGMLVLGIALSFISQKSYSQCLTNDSLSINSSQADSLERLCVLYNGRIAPLQTLAWSFI